MKRVAIPVFNDKLSENFGHCSYYQIFDISEGNIDSYSVNVPSVRSVLNLPGWISQQGITDLIVHKIDRKIISLFAGNKVNIFVGVPVKSPGLLIEDYLNGNLRSDEKIIKEITDNTIRLALAVDHTGHLKAKHFGEADKYLLYEIGNAGLTFLKEEINPYKNLDEKVEHGSVRKGRAIMDFLSDSGVKVLISRQFGKNIKLVNSMFIPVIVSSDEPEEVLGILVKYVKWIIDEMKNNSGSYRLFTLKKGIIKKSVPQD